MIISCEQCQTQFKLDESRIPAGGARVRCSKCEHSFVVQPPEVEAEAESTLQGIAAGTVQEAVPVPESETVAPSVTDPSLSKAMDPCDLGEVPPEEWTFDDEPPSNASGLSGTPARGAKPVEEELTAQGSGESALETSGVKDDFGGESPVHSAAVADLAQGFEERPVSAIEEEFATPPSAAAPTDAASLFGAPGDLGESGTFRNGLVPAPEAPAENAASVAPPAVVDNPSGTSGTAAVEVSSLEEVGDPKNWDILEDQAPDPHPLDEAEREDAEEETVTAPSPVRRRPRPWFHPETPAHALGWCLAILLICAGLFGVVHNTLVPTSHSTADNPERVLASHAGAASVQSLTVRSLENLYGPILVIAGVANQSAARSSGLQVQLLDAQGKALEGAVAWAGPVLDEDRLREEDPRLLQASLVRRTGALGPGSAFHAVFEQVPAEAFGVAIDQQVLPSLSAAEEAPNLEGRTPEEGSTENSLPPTPSPSRE